MAHDWTRSIMKQKHNLHWDRPHARAVIAALGFGCLAACAPAMTATEKYSGIADPRSFWLHAIKTQQSYDYRFCLAEKMVASASPELEKDVDVFLADKTDSNFHFVAMRFYIETATPEFQDRFSHTDCLGEAIYPHIADLPDFKLAW